MPSATAVKSSLDCLDAVAFRKGQEEACWRVLTSKLEYRAARTWLPLIFSRQYDLANRSFPKVPVNVRKSVQSPRRGYRRGRSQRHHRLRCGLETGKWRTRRAGSSAPADAAKRWGNRNLRRSEERRVGKEGR